MIHCNPDYPYKGFPTDFYIEGESFESSVEIGGGLVPRPKLNTFKILTLVKLTLFLVIWPIKNGNGFPLTSRTHVALKRI